MKEIYEISTEYMKDLKKLLNNKQISPYDMAHASFRKNNADLIIKRYNKRELTIKYLDGTTQKFPTYNEFIKMIRNLNDLYPKNRRDYVKRYFDVVQTYAKHRREMRRRKTNTIANALNPEHLRMLAQQI